MASERYRIAQINDVLVIEDLAVRAGEPIAGGIAEHRPLLETLIAAANRAEALALDVECLKDGDVKLHVGSTPSELLAQIFRLNRRVEELEAIVKRLPRTADGVPIVPGMTVWEARGRDVYRMKNFRATLPDAEGFSESNWEKGWSSVCRLDRIFSTEAAALAAKEVQS